MVAYATARGLLPVPDSLPEVIRRSRAEISDFRDDAVTHTRDARNVTATAVSKDGDARPLVIPTFGSGGRQINGRGIREIEALIHDDVQAIDAYCRANLAQLEVHSAAPAARIVAG